MKKICFLHSLPSSDDENSLEIVAQIDAYLRYLDECRFIELVNDHNEGADCFIVTFFCRSVELESIVLEISGQNATMQCFVQRSSSVLSPLLAEEITRRGSYQRICSFDDAYDVYRFVLALVGSKEYIPATPGTMIEVRLAEK